jgi:hypothetical protein
MARPWIAGALGLAGLALILAAGLAGEGEPAVTEADVRALLLKWRARDGAAALEAGHALSKAFLSSPDAFLNAMSHDSKSWFSWLEGLPRHSFTVTRAADVPERDRLLKKMQAAARSYPPGKSLVTMARQLADRLEQVQVRQAD